MQPRICIWVSVCVCIYICISVPFVCEVDLENKYSILFYYILFYSILFYSILFYSILFYSILFYSILGTIFSVDIDRENKSHVAFQLIKVYWKHIPLYL